MPRTLTPGQVLTAEDEGLLNKGDVLLDEVSGPVEFLEHWPKAGGLHCAEIASGRTMCMPYSLFRFIGTPAPDGFIPAPEGGWKENPVGDAWIEVRLRSGETYRIKGSATNRWLWAPVPGLCQTDIIAFRLSRPEASATETTAEHAHRLRLENDALQHEIVTAAPETAGPVAEFWANVDTTPPAPASSPETGELRPVMALAVSADFEPEDTPAGYVEWTFAVPDTTRFGAGFYQISFSRCLTGDEIKSPDAPYAALAAATRPDDALSDAVVAIAGVLLETGERSMNRRRISDLANKALDAIKIARASPAQPEVAPTGESE